MKIRIEQRAARLEHPRHFTHPAVEFERVSQRQSRYHHIETCLRERQPSHVRKNARTPRSRCRNIARRNIDARPPPPLVRPPSASCSVLCRRRGRARAGPGFRETARPWLAAPPTSAGCAARRHRCPPTVRRPRASQVHCVARHAGPHLLLRRHACAVRRREPDAAGIKSVAFVRVPPERTHAGPAFGSPARSNGSRRSTIAALFSAARRLPRAAEEAGPGIKKHGLTRPSAPTTAENSGALQRTGG